MNSILTELLPRKVRLWLYVIVTFASGAVAAYVASNGDWLAFAGALLASLTSLLAAANVNPPPLVVLDPEPDPLVTQAYPSPEPEPPADFGNRL